MALALLLFISVMCAPAYPMENDMCTIEDGEICSVIVSNQISISNIDNGIRDLVRDVGDQLQKNSEEMDTLKDLLNENQTDEAAALKQYIENCKAKVGEQQSKVTNLKKKQTQATQAMSSVTTQLEQLEEEVEAQKQKKTQMEERIRCLKEDIKGQVVQMEDLTIKTHVPRDCADLLLQGHTESGVYNIYPFETEEPVEVQCDFDCDGGGWTVFFNRVPQEDPVSFDATWNEFKNGFGKASGEYWLGNDLLHILTSDIQTSLRVDATNFTGGQRWATWNKFAVANEEDKYQLTLANYQQNSTLGDSLTVNDKCYFSAKDVDNDNINNYNCAHGSHYSNIAPGAWWYDACGLTRLTAPLVNTGIWNSAIWTHWDPHVSKPISLKAFSLKFRRNNYADSNHITDDL